VGRNDISSPAPRTAGLGLKKTGSGCVSLFGFKGIGIETYGGPHHAHEGVLVASHDPGPRRRRQFPSALNRE